MRDLLAQFIDAIRSKPGGLDERVEQVVNLRALRCSWRRRARAG